MPRPWYHALRLHLHSLTCHVWDLPRRFAHPTQQYRAKPGRQAPQSGIAATNAGGTGSGGGGARPTSAGAIGRYASGLQQAACSPAPTHHLLSHDPFVGGASGSRERRRFASVCHPANLHSLLQHHSSTPSVRKL